jgi:excisionase family DNA binding protein
MQTETAPSSISHHKIAFTIKEAARASGLSRSMLYVAIGDGALRARKCGARTLILDTDLRRFLRSLPRLAKAETRLSAG